MEIRLEMLLIVMLFMTTTTTTTASVSAFEFEPSEARSSLLDNAISRSLRFIYNQCADSEDIFWCSKVQVTKMLGRALKVPNIIILDGVSIVKKSIVDNDTREGRATVTEEQNYNNKELENLSLKSLDSLLFSRFLRFIRSRQLQVNLPRLLAFGQRNAEQLISYILSFFTQDELIDESEGRKKKDDKKYLGPFVAAVMLKAAILKMAYHSIAIIAGKALIVGKIALIISSIIGLKKLVSSEGGEKTTYEIVKHPQVQQSHTYSSSHTGEYEGGHESGSYHRSIDDEMMMQDKAYNAWVPTAKVS